MVTFNEKLGIRLKEIRVNKNLQQSDIAEILSVDRVSISHIEKGQRKITIEELHKLADYYNKSVDVLIDTDKDIQVVLEHSKDLELNSEMRISVPQKKIEKFKEILIYILNKVGSKSNIGESVIYKMLYFIDFDFYEIYEEQIIGANYIKNNYGPTPVEFRSIVNEMEGNDITKIATKYYNYPQTKYLPLREANLKILKAHEIHLIDDVLNRLSDMSATEISEYSHKDVPWLTSENKNVIDYESVFYRTEQFSRRSYCND